MVELTRRWFLGGALSAVAIVAAQPTVAKELLALSARNLPRIWADGRNYDADGIIALLRGEEVMFPRDKLSIKDAQQVIIHSGNYQIDREIEVAGFRRFSIEAGTFDGTPLQHDWEAMFSIPSGEPDWWNDRSGTDDGNWDNGIKTFQAELFINNPRVQFARKGSKLAVKVRRDMELRYDCNKVAYWQGNVSYPTKVEI